MTRAVNKTGWGGSDTGGSPSSLLSDLPTGLLAMSGDQVVAVDPSWSAGLFTVAGLFNNTSIIENYNATVAGAMRVLRDGLYMLYVYGTNRNTTTTCEMNLRFVKNGTDVIPNSNHQIYEHNTDNDRDMICKGVPVVLQAGDYVNVQFNSNNANTTLKGDATWMIQLATGVQGATGPQGPASFDTEEFSVYRNLAPTNQDITNGRNIFYNEGTSPGNVTCSAGSPDVTGASSPAFLSNVAAGDVMEVTDDGGVQRFYKVLTVLTNTTLTLAENAVDDFTAKAWRIYTPRVTAFYNNGNKFDVTKAIWTPSAGKHQVSACGAFGDVGDTNWAYVYLYNVTQNMVVANGGRGRNEGNGQFNSVLSCQIEANGTDDYALFCDSNDGTIDIQGIDSYKTYMMGFKFSES